MSHSSTTRPIETQHPTTRYLASITLGATLLLVAVGGFTRGSGSGYGCADRWPLCENGALGGLFPRAEYHMVIEWSHRWLAAWVGILAIVTTVGTWRHFRRNRTAVRASTAAVFAIGIQAWVGREVVTRHLDADLVSVHLAISMTVVALLVVAVISMRPSRPTPSERDIIWAAQMGVGAAAVLVVLLLGSLVHNEYVAGWPLVFDTWAPNLETGTVAIHFLHRVAAGGMAVYLGYLVVDVRRRRRPLFERRGVDAAAGVYAANIGLGAAHIFTRVQSPALVAAHLALASLVWALTVAVVTHASRDPRLEPVSDPLVRAGK